MKSFHKCRQDKTRSDHGGVLSTDQKENNKSTRPNECMWQSLLRNILRSELEYIFTVTREEFGLVAD